MNAVAAATKWQDLQWRDERKSPPRPQRLGTVNTMAPTELAVAGTEKGADLSPRPRALISVGSSRARSSARCSRRHKTGRHGRKRGYQTDARRGKQVSRGHLSLRHECSDVGEFSREAAARKKRRRNDHKCRAQHRPAGCPAADDEHDHQRRANDGRRAPVADGADAKAQQERQVQAGDPRPCADAVITGGLIKILRVTRIYRRA